MSCFPSFTPPQSASSVCDRASAPRLALPPTSQNDPVTPWAVPAPTETISRLEKAVSSSQPRGEAGTPSRGHTSRARTAHVLQRVLRQRQRAELPAERGQDARALVAEQGDQGRAALGGVSRHRHRSRSRAGPRRSRCGPPEYGSRAAPPRRGRRTRAGRSRSGPPWSRRTARRSPRSWRTVVAVVVGYSAAPPRSTAATVWPKAPYSAVVCRFSSVSSALQSGSPGS